MGNGGAADIGERGSGRYWDAWERQTLVSRGEADIGEREILGSGGAGVRPTLGSGVSVGATDIAERGSGGATDIAERRSGRYWGAG